MSRQSRHVLIFWPESNTTTIVSEKKILEIWKPSALVPGYTDYLPWTENNEVEFFEAKVISILRNKKKLGLIRVDSTGEIIKNTTPELLQERRLLKQKMGKNNAAYNKNLKSLKHSTMEMEDISSIPSSSKNSGAKKQWDKNVNRNSTANPKASPSPSISPVEESGSSNGNATANLTMESPGSSTSDVEVNGRDNICCRCANLFPLVTPEVKTFLQALLQSIDNKGSTDNLLVEIHPNSGLKMTESQLSVLRGKSGTNSHHYVRNILQHFVSQDELYECGTATNVLAKFSTIQMATLGYLKRNLNEDMTFSMYNRIVNRKIQTIREKRDLTPEQREELKEKRRKSVQDSRDKKRLKLESNNEAEKIGDDALDCEKEANSDELNLSQPPKNHKQSESPVQAPKKRQTKRQTKSYQSTGVSNSEMINPVARTQIPRQNQGDGNISDKEETALDPAIKTFKNLHSAEDSRMKDMSFSNASAKSHVGDNSLNPNSTTADQATNNTDHELNKVTASPRIQEMTSSNSISPPPKNGAQRCNYPTPPRGDQAQYDHGYPMNGPPNNHGTTSQLPPSMPNHFQPPNMQPQYRGYHSDNYPPQYLYPPISPYPNNAYGYYPPMNYPVNNQYYHQAPHPQQSSAIDFQNFQNQQQSTVNDRPSLSEIETSTDQSFLIL